MTISRHSQKSKNRAGIYDIFSYYSSRLQCFQTKDSPRPVMIFLSGSSQGTTSKYPLQCKQTSLVHNSCKQLLSKCCMKNHSLLFVWKLPPSSFSWWSLILVLKEPVNSQSISTLLVILCFSTIFLLSYLQLLLFWLKSPTISHCRVAILYFWHPYCPSLKFLHLFCLFGDQGLGKPTSLIRYLSDDECYCLWKRGMLTTLHKKMLVL